MTLHFSAGDEEPVDLAEVTQSLMRDAAEELARACSRVGRSGPASWRRSRPYRAWSATCATRLNCFRKRGAVLINSANRLPGLSEPECSIFTPQGMRSGAGWLSSATQGQVDAFLGGLSDNALLALPWMFEFWALPHQLPPAGACKTWVILGGGGAGKTRAGSEWVRAQVEGSFAR